MNISNGTSSIITVELPDGRVLRSLGFVTGITYSGMDGANRCTLEAILFGGLELSQAEYWERVRVASTSEEWMCEYCRTPNKRAHTNCTKCNAARGFIYGPRTK